MVSKVSPATGAGGGATLTITGANLANATLVNFGQSGATIISDSATEILVTDPVGSSGYVDVTVTTAGGTSATSSADQFTYVSGPTVSGVNPAAGSLSGGATVTITGTNLGNAATVMFGNNPATIISDSATQILATDPAGSAGTVDVTVTTVGGASATSTADQFTYEVVPSVGREPNSRAVGRGHDRDDHGIESGRRHRGEVWKQLGGHHQRFGHSNHRHR